MLKYWEFKLHFSTKFGPESFKNISI